MERMRERGEGGQADEGTSGRENERKRERRATSGWGSERRGTSGSGAQSRRATAAGKVGRRKALAACEGGTWRRRVTVVNDSGRRRWRLIEEGGIRGRLWRIKVTGGSAGRPRRTAASDGRIWWLRWIAAADGTMPGKTSIGRGGPDNDSVLKHVINISLLFIILVLPSYSFNHRRHRLPHSIPPPALGARIYSVFTSTGDLCTIKKLKY